jgi:hypothetical protein
VEDPPVGPDLDPVDRVALGRLQRAVEPVDRTDVAGGGAAALRGEPTAAAQRRRQERRLPGADRDGARAVLELFGFRRERVQGAHLEARGQVLGNRFL